MAKKKLELKKRVEKEYPLDSTPSVLEDGKLVPLSKAHPLYDAVDKLWDDESFEKGGYQCDSWEPSSGNAMEFFYRKRKTKLTTEWQYVLIWSPTSSHGSLILCQSQIDLLNAMQLLTPYLLLGLHECLDDLRTMGKRSFRLRHGHAFYDACDRCDPDQMNVRRQEIEFAQRRKEAAAKKAKKAS
jgi:hypothetical protein